MRLKPEVQYAGVQRQIWYAVGVADTVHKLIFNTDVVVTSMMDGTHNPGSLHPKGLACDLRIRGATDTQAKGFLDELKAMLPPGFDVVFEGGVGATPVTTGAHIHVEFDPKHKEQFEQVLA